MKHVSCIEGIDNLRAIVRHDLREQFIKVPKPKKSRRHGGTSKSHQDSAKSSGIFGNLLAEVPCVFVSECGYVPKFLVDAANIIIDNIEQEGIFRKSGSLSRQKDLKLELEEGKGFADVNVHDVTALVKQFFRELPEPLFSSSYHDTFIRCYQLEDPEAALRAVLLLCLLLPGEHISTLRFTLQLLSQIAAASDKNKMDANNLAVVLAPNIMHVNNKKNEKMNASEERLLQVQLSVVELLIQHADQVGMVDEELASRTAFMSEVFSTDDELDASEDNLEDSKDTRKKDKKKRKRSGSFQGFVSSIAQSITKWRRSTDGKTNVSNLSQGSNLSKMTVCSQSKGNVSTKSDDMPPCPPASVYHFSAAEATPVVRRKKPANPDTRPFSATKKKAILQQLPQHAALANTPFTPASSMKKLDMNSARRVPGDTPSLRAHPGTPRHCIKTPRKKLTLFSPGSSLKKKRYSSTTNISVQSSKKPAKTKGIFRRLSGSREDQIPVAQLQSNPKTAQIGQRLAASPSATANSSVLESSDISHPHNPSDHPISDESPIAAIMHTSHLSSSVCEQSVISTCGEGMSLNEGFILNGDDKDMDMSVFTDPDKDSGEYVFLGNVPRGCKSDTTLHDNAMDTTSMLKCHNRSYSAEDSLDGSLRRRNLKRGQPNSIKAGLLQGDQKEVHKLRRSFGLDKSDIGFPIPVSVPNTSDGDAKYLDVSVDMRSSCQSSSNEDSQRLTDVSSDFPMSVSQCRSVSSSSVEPRDNSLMGLTGKGDNSETTEAMETMSEGGFSAISGGTAVFVPQMKTCTIDLDQANEKCADFVNKATVTSDKKLAEQKSESVDSLFSEASCISNSSSPLSSHKEMTRSISADSGKGSMYGEPMVEEATEEGGFSSEKLGAMLPGPDTMPRKSVSSHDLQQEAKISTPVGVTRSKSLLDSSVTRMKPNLQISAETHKLLARAGYIRDQKTPGKEKQDFPVSGSYMKPMTLEQQTIRCPQPDTVSDQGTEDIRDKADNSGLVADDSDCTGRDNTDQEEENQSVEPVEDNAAEQLEHPDQATLPLKPDDHDFAVPFALPTIKQCSEAVNPRRESIVALKKKNAGYVANNVKQFDRLKDDGMVERLTSPLRFAKSTSRRCAASPLRIPTIFAKTETQADTIRQSLRVDEKLSFGTARLPISTQLIKPSGPVSSDMEMTTDSAKKVSQIKRKPSIYYAAREALHTGSKANGAPKSLDVSDVQNCSIAEMPDSGSEPEADDRNDIGKVGGNCDHVVGSDSKSILSGQSVDLNQSLEQTINDICTPLSEKYQQYDRVGSSNKENNSESTDLLNKSASKLPLIKPSILNMPLAVESFALRTVSGKTPVDVLKSSRSPRSPVKALKRLGGSPRSPRCRPIHSPNRVLHSRPKFSTPQAPDIDDLNNL